MNQAFLKILIIFCCFAGEAILTWSLSNDIDGLPTSLINPLWHLLEQTVILLWSWTHHHQLEKKIAYPFADVRQTVSKPASVTSTINLCALLKEKYSFSRTALWRLFCFLNQFCWQLFSCALHKVVCLSSEFLYAGTSKQVRIPSISFCCNQCLKATFKWTLQYVFIQGK